MKRHVLLALAMGSLALSSVPASHAEKATMKERFYGKITRIDMDRRSLDVHNKKKDTDVRFQWDQQTNFIHQKKAIQASDLKLGQSLIISYVPQENGNLATRVTVRPIPSRKKPAKSENNE